MWLFSSMAAIVIVTPEYALLTFSVAVIAVALLAQWQRLIEQHRLHVFIDTPAQYLQHPKRNELLATGSCSGALLALFVLLTGRVYTALPFNYTLFSSTTETNRSLAVIMADFDGDGDLDYTVGNVDGGPAKLDLYLNDGAGSYSHSTYGRSNQFKDFAAGDVDGDGDIDVVGAYDTNCDRVFFNNGSGVFTDPGDMTECARFGASSSVVELSDVDQDGDLDRITMSDAYTLTEAVELNNGNGGFTNVPSVLPPAWAMTMADYNSDGAVDLAFTNPNGHNVYIYANSGTGSFTQLWSDTIVTTPYNKNLVSGDIDGDGDIDLILSGENGQLYPITNNGTGIMTIGSALSPTQTRNMALVDGDIDGDLDMIYGAYDIGATIGGTSLWLNNGSGIFSNGNTPTTERGDCTTAVAVGDIDGDFDPDYVTANESADCFTGGAANRIYVSDAAPAQANPAPSAPASGFSATGSVRTAGTEQMYAGAGSADASAGTAAWSSTINIVSSDNSWATSDIAGIASSYFLVGSSMGFNIPTGSEITGVKVEWEKRATAVTSPIYDSAVRLYVGGVINGTNHATGTQWPTAIDLYSSYGGSTDDWGVTLTPAIVNAGDFGAVISANKPTGVDTTTAFVDTVRMTVYYMSGANVRLYWGSGSDANTPARQLQYQVRVGTVSNGNDIVSGKTTSPNYTDRLMPNGQSRTRALNNLACNQTYYWAVRTVDSGLRTSAESAEQTFTVGTDCMGGGGGGTTGGSTGGGGSSSVGGGGGVGYWLGVGSNGDTQTEELNAVPTGTLKGKIFVDVNGNGKQEQGERGGFGGVRVEVEGTDIRGEDVSRSVVTDTQGAFVLAVPAGSYHVRAVETGGKLSGFAMVQADGISVTVEGGAQAEAWVGVRSQKFVGTSYKPCLQVGTVETDGTTDLAQALLNGLETIYGQKLVGEEGLQGPLVSRKQFFELLTGTQCLKLEKSGEALKQQLRSAAKERGWSQAVLHDAAVPEGLGSGWRSSVYALLAAGVPAGRSAGKELVADPEAPITKREAMAMVAAVLKLEPVTGEEVALPPDALEGDKEAGVFGALKKIGVLPKGFEVALAGGMTPSEASELLVKAAFAGGKLAMTASADEEQWEPVGLPAYLEAAGIGARRACLVQDGSRALAVRSDVLPNAPGQLFQRLSLLLSLGMKDEEGRFRWLLTGSRPGEYGVRAGIIGIGERKPVTWAALSDIGMKFTCHPLESYQEALLRTGGGGVDVSQGGTANVIFAPDRLFNTPDGPGYVQRVVHSMQRPVRQFDLSPVTFAKELTLEPARDIGGVVSLGEGSKMLASFILYTRVQEGVLGRVEAEGILSDLSTAILSELSGVPKEEAWRKAGANKAQALTWSQLITVLSDVLGPEMADTPLEVLPQGEAWWGVLR